MSKKVLVVVDYQTDFVTGALRNEAAIPLEAPIAAMVRKTLDEGGKVLFTRDTHTKDYLETREGKYLPIPHCLKGTEGWHLHGSLTQYEAVQSDNIAIVNKPTFGSAALPGEVQALCGGAPDEIAVCGVVTEICVISNSILLHSSFLEAKMTVYGNLCAGLSPEAHNKALDTLRGMGYKVV